MRVIIAGGTGLIGRDVSASLLAEGHEVIILSRKPEAFAANIPGVRPIRWDAKTSEGWAHLADGAEAIVNLAGESISGSGLIPARWTPAHKARILQTRLDATSAIVQAVERASVRPRVVIQASAVGYYGPTGDAIVTEDQPPGNDFLSWVCVQWENASRRLEDLGVRRPLVRIGLALSARGGVLPRLALPVQFFAGGPFGSGQQWYPWIHMDDVVRAIRFLMADDDARGAYNLTAPNPLTNREFSQVLGRVMHRPSILPVPTLALKLALGEMATLVLDGQRAVPQRLLQRGFTFRFETAEAALTDLLRSDLSLSRQASYGAAHSEGTH
jgi:uncharacterized protein (TIGR01777 family)